MRKILIGFYLVALSTWSHAADLSGHWRFDDPCQANGVGGHFSLTLSQDRSGKYYGEWEESTNSKGWAGKLRGSVKGKILTVNRCIDPDSSSWDMENTKRCPDTYGTETFQMKGRNLIRMKTGEHFKKSKEELDENELAALFHCRFE